MHQDRDIDLSNNVMGLTRRQWSGSERYHISKYSSQGHAYSIHPVGLPFILAPFFDGVHDYREALIIMCIMGALLASQMYLAVFEETGSASVSLWVWIVLSFSSPLWVYSYEAWPMLPCGLCLLYAWRRMRNFEDNSFYQIVILNLAMVWLLWLHLSFIVCYAILGILLLYRLIRKLRDVRILAAVIFQALNVGIFLWFHYRWFGKHLFGLEGKILSFWPGMLGTWFDSHWGMVFAGPIHLLCFILIFVYAFKKRNLSVLVLLALYAAGFVIGTGTYHWKHRLWGAHPGRRLVGLIPLTCIGLGYFLNRRRTTAFYWLAGFLSLLSLTYMLFFILNPGDLDRPIHHLASSLRLFRTIHFNLPALGRHFHHFPRIHFRAVTVNFLLFVLFWTLLLVKERKGNKPHAGILVRDEPKFLFVGMWVTVLWIFISAGWMKTHFQTRPPIPWNTNTNCVGKHNRAAIGHPPLEKGLYRYLLYGLDKTQEKLSWSVEIKERLQGHLDLAKGVYRFRIAGTASPLLRERIAIVEVLESKELGSFPVLVDAEQKFSHELEINLPRLVNRIKLQPSSHNGEQKSQIIFKEIIITPIPEGLESLVSKIEAKGKPSGWVYLD
jgi:hypothetical protein